ncbi:MAG: hypothetical protein MUO27_09060 [Sedimentisphaerales bacterium]|nr:hypothetical protein [Sedimentisphaerales bacterium]
MPTLGGLACLNNNIMLFYLCYMILLKIAELSTSSAATANELKDFIDFFAFPDQAQLRIDVYEVESIHSHGISFISATLNDLTHVKVSKLSPAPICGCGAVEKIEIASSLRSSQ